MLFSIFIIFPFSIKTSFSSIITSLFLKSNTFPFLIKILSIHASKTGLEYRLPVVIENGTIKASISEVVCTKGTLLNERMQDFLLAVDEYSATCTDKPVEQIKVGFTELLKKYIEINNDNVIGSYIRTAYRSSL